MYEVDIKEEVDKVFKKLSKKNKVQLQIIFKKIDEIKTFPFHKYKFLKKPLQMFNRVHIDNSFVLIFKIDYLHKIIEIWFYGHHDDIYKWRPKV